MVVPHIERALQVHAAWLGDTGPAQQCSMTLLCSASLRACAWDLHDPNPDTLNTVSPIAACACTGQTGKCSAQPGVCIGKLLGSCRLLYSLGIEEPPAPCKR